MSESTIPFPMDIDWDVPITMDDGIVLRTDVYRPKRPGRYPVIISYGPYGKGLHFEDGYKTAWDIMARGFAWGGKTYPSLSKVAFAITGTRWNGPKFFGLRDSAAKGSAS